MKSPALAANLLLFCVLLASCTLEQEEKTGLDAKPVLWSVQHGSTENATVGFASCAVDSQGNIYIAGHIKGYDTHDFGNSVSVAGVSNLDTAMLVKYDSAGKARWVRINRTANQYSAFSGVSVDAEDNPVVSGQIYRGTSDFGNGVTLNGTSTSASACLVKYDPDGNALWGTTIAETSEFVHSRINEVAFDSAGDYWFVGYTAGRGTYNFDAATPVVMDNFKNAFLAKCGKDGTLKFVKILRSDAGPSTSVHSAYSRVIVRGSSIYVAGTLGSTAAYEAENAVTVSGNNLDRTGVLVKYDTAGNAVWAKASPADLGVVWYGALSADASGNICVGGASILTKREKIILRYYSRGGLESVTSLYTTEYDITDGFNSAVCAPDGKMYFGTTSFYNDNFHFLVTCLDYAADRNWVSSVGASGADGDLAVTESGQLIVAYNNYSVGAIGNIMAYDLR